MKTALLFLLPVFFLSSSSHSQPLPLEDFEGGATPMLPPGWGVFNDAGFPIPDSSNWTVRDSALAVPGLATATSQAHNSLRSVGVSWLAGTDTVTGNLLQADAWLITPRVENIQVGDSLRFWGTGGSTNWDDSIQIWIGDIDSTPSGMTFQLASIYWPVGSTYGGFMEYAYDLSIVAGIGIPIWIGFRYNTDVTNAGFFVYLDDISISSPTSVDQTDAGVPDKFSLSQNYPNPFNPSTAIHFSLPSSGYVSLNIFNTLGEEVATLVAEQLTPGTYKVEWIANGIPSGVYFYRLQVGRFVDTRKLVLLK